MIQSIELVKLLAKNACVLEEDLRLMEGGAVTVQAFGADVTREHATRLKGNLRRIEQIMDLLGC